MSKYEQAPVSIKVPVEGAYENHASIVHQRGTSSFGVNPSHPEIEIPLRGAGVYIQYDAQSHRANVVAVSYGVDPHLKRALSERIEGHVDAVRNINPDKKLDVHYELRLWDMDTHVMGVREVKRRANGDLSALVNKILRHREERMQEE